MCEAAIKKKKKKGLCTPSKNTFIKSSVEVGSQIWNDERFHRGSKTRTGLKKGKEFGF